MTPKDEAAKILRLQFSLSHKNKEVFLLMTPFLPSPHEHPTRLHSPPAFTSYICFFGRRELICIQNLHVLVLLSVQPRQQVVKQVPLVQELCLGLSRVLSEPAEVPTGVSGHKVPGW